MCWYRCTGENTIPTKIPANRPADRDYGQTVAIKSRGMVLFLRMFRTSANICEHEVVPRGGVSKLIPINDFAAGGTLNPPAGSSGLFPRLSHLNLCAAPRSARLLNGLFYPVKLARSRAVDESEGRCPSPAHARRKRIFISKKFNSGDEPAGAIAPCPLLSKSGQAQARSVCPLCANTGHRASGAK